MVVQPFDHLHNQPRSSGHLSASQGTVSFPKDDPRSLPPGCRRSYDFFAHVCQSPWAASYQPPSDPGPAADTSPAVHGDLLICDLPDPEPWLKPESEQHDPKAPRVRTIAISGTITFQDDLARGDAKKPIAADSKVDPSSLPAQSFPSNPDELGSAYPAPGDEGFWRQRNGQHEWHPSQPDPLVVASVSDPHSIDHLVETPIPSQHTQAHSTGPSVSSDGREPAHIRAYDAWSAEQEGDGFLSFSEWKEKYIDSVRKENDQEKTKSKAKRNKKTKDSNSSSAPPHPTLSDSEPPLNAPTREHPSSNASYLPQQTGSQPPSPSSSSASDIPSHSSETSPGSQAHRQSDDSDSNQVEVVDEGHSGDPRGAPDASNENDKKSDEVDAGPSDEPPRSPKSVTQATDSSSKLAALKHRWNFASLDCAAVVHRTNPSAKFASAILSEKKDRYMLSPCPSRSSSKKGEGQFVIVELCDDIMVDTIVLANYEFFSSMFKKFRVRVASQLKGRDDDWVDLGSFRARNMRGLQVFSIPPSSAVRGKFFRYVRIDFLEHYGSEFYCPVSLLRVYGITQMDDINSFREDAEDASDLDEIADTESDPEEEDLLLQTETLVPSPSAIVGETQPNSTLPPADLTVKDEDVWRKHERLFRERLELESNSRGLVLETSFPAGTDDPPPRLQSTPTRASHAGRETRSVMPENRPNSSTSVQDHNAGDINPSDKCIVPPFPSEMQLNATCQAPSLYPGAESGDGKSRKGGASHSATNSRSEASVQPSSQPDARLPSEDVGRGSLPKARSDDTVKASQPQRASPVSGSSVHPPPRNAHPNPNQQSGPSGGGSESIYRTITRRLNALEANATLSLHYIEHSGQMLREVFSRMEKRQDARMSEILRALNASNWRQIETLKRRQQVDLQRAIFEFDVHRQQAELERVALMNEVHLLADEVLLEKRLGIAQLVLLFSLFIFVGLTRGSRAAPFLHSSIARISRGTKPKKAPDTKETATKRLAATSANADQHHIPRKASIARMEDLKVPPSPKVSNAKSLGLTEAPSVEGARSTPRKHSSNLQHLLGSPMSPEAVKAAQRSKRSHVRDRPVSLAGYLLGPSPYLPSHSKRQTALMRQLGPLIDQRVPGRSLAKKLQILSALLDSVVEDEANRTKSSSRSASLVSNVPRRVRSGTMAGLDSQSGSAKENADMSLADLDLRHSTKGLTSATPKRNGSLRSRERTVLASTTNANGDDDTQALVSPRGQVGARARSGLARRQVVKANNPESPCGTTQYARILNDEDPEYQAGLSSDWTERSGDQSESNLLSDDDDDGLEGWGGIAAARKASGTATNGMNGLRVMTELVPTSSMGQALVTSPELQTPSTARHADGDDSGFGPVRQVHLATRLQSNGGHPHSSEESASDSMMGKQDDSRFNLSHRANAISASDNSSSETGVQESRDDARNGVGMEKAEDGFGPAMKSYQGDRVSGLTDRLSPLGAQTFPRTADSDSDSEGGAWQRVLPRRSASNSLSRKSRQSTPEGKTASRGGASEAQTSFLKRWSTTPRPFHDKNRGPASSKPTTPESGKRSWSKSHSAKMSESPHRSGTPDTIRS